MNGLETFIKLFGDITILNVIEFIIAVVFLVVVYKKIKKWIDDKYKQEAIREEKEKNRDEQIKEALDGVHKYPDYRKQSLQIQDNLEKRISAHDKQIADLKNSIDEIKQLILDMQEKDNIRELNKLRDRLIQNYRYYTNKEKNPEQKWTKMEAQAFWALFADYEERGGDGYMHETVEPEMRALIEV